MKISLLTFAAVLAPLSAATCVKLKADVAPLPPSTTFFDWARCICRNELKGTAGATQAAGTGGVAYHVFICNGVSQDWAKQYPNGKFYHAVLSVGGSNREYRFRSIVRPSDVCPIS
ncbi:hypothetical protein MPH_05298, partial [Macrophomina phaseolina MS6]